MDKKSLATLCFVLSGGVLIYMAGYAHGSTVMINYYGKILSKEVVGYLAGIDAVKHMFGEDDAESD